HLPCLVQNRDSQRWRLNTENDRGHDTEERQGRGQQDGREDEHLRAHTLDVFPFDDCQKLFHAASVTFVMKMSLRLGSTISNFPITAPESIKRFRSICASAPAASSAWASSACRTTLLTSAGSSNTPSPP